jgi:hypothetical protein
MNIDDTMITSPTSIDGVLEKAVEAAYQAVLAISEGDQASARSRVDQLRFLKALANPREAGQAGAAERVIPTGATVQRMRCAMEALAISEGVIQDWVQQGIRSVASGEVSDADDIWQRLIDHALPASWNFEADLFVVHGDFDPQVQQALASRGQRRMLFVVDEVSPATPTPDGEVYRVSNEAQILATLGALKRPYPDRIAKLDLRGDALPDQPDHDALIHKAVMGLWVNFNTTKWFARTWLEQGIGNIPLVASQHNLSELDGVFQGRPAVLIAPGPSLEKNIDQLRALKGKALLIAPLQTLRRLYLARVQPDFVVVLDPQDQTTETCNFFRDVPDDFLPPLIVAANGHPNVIRKFRQVYFYSSGGPVDHWIEASMGQPLIPLHAPSVALIGLLLARHWQCSPIVLTGQDLALQDGKQYAADANLGPGGKRKLFSLPGYHGGTVQSPSDYYMFHHQFELIARDMGERHPQLALYNCTEGGAYIQGFEHAPLQQVAALHFTRDLARSATGPTHHSDVVVEARQQRTNSARDHLQKTVTAIDASRRQAALCKRMTLNPSQGPKFLKKLATEEHLLRALIKQIEGFSTLYQGDIDRALKASAQATSLKGNLEASRALYAVIDGGCAFIRPLVVQALERLCAPESGASPLKPADSALPELV